MRSRAGVYRAVWNFSWERLDSNLPSYPGDMLDTYTLIDSQPDTCLTHGVRNRLLASPSCTGHLLLKGTCPLLTSVGRTGYWSVGVLSMGICSITDPKYQGNWEQNCHRSQLGRGEKGSSQVPK